MKKYCGYCGNKKAYLDDYNFDIKKLIAHEHLSNKIKSFRIKLPRHINYPAGVDEQYQWVHSVYRNPETKEFVFVGGKADGDYGSQFIVMVVSFPKDYHKPLARLEKIFHVDQSKDLYPVFLEADRHAKQYFNKYYA
jgi:hypothetical protein